jgi:nitroimidazol reductase NimA-like FMN-containing flavoprotein (pyridoxamine 5'-phosphate oxidase superfamily)
MRRKDKEITDQATIRKILHETHYITLAMVKDNEPYLVSLSHVYDEEKNCIYFHCAKEGKKLDYLKTNNTVWGQAIKDYGYHVGECSHLYATVMFKGTVTFVDDVEEKRHSFKIMIEHMDPDPETMKENLLKSDGIPSTHVAKISLDYISGKKSAEITL